VLLTSCGQHREKLTARAERLDDGMGEASESELKPWQWPRKWVREETFWREMTTRTLSALLAAAVLFVGARGAGLFPQIPWSTVLLWCGISLGVVITLPIVLGLVIFPFRQRIAGRESRELMRLAFRHAYTTGKVPADRVDEFHYLMKGFFGDHWLDEGTFMSPERLK
jgi:hypothetical protein